MQANTCHLVFSNSCKAPHFILFCTTYHIRSNVGVPIQTTTPGHPRPYLRQWGMLSVRVKLQTSVGLFLSTYLARSTRWSHHGPPWSTLPKVAKRIVIVGRWRNRPVPQATTENNIPPSYSERHRFGISTIINRYVLLGNLTIAWFEWLHATKCSHKRWSYCMLPCHYREPGRANPRRF
jgi:hypothetical protein